MFFYIGIKIFLQNLDSKSENFQVLLAAHSFCLQDRIFFSSGMTTFMQKISSNFDLDTPHIFSEYQIRKKKLKSCKKS